MKKLLLLTIIILSFGAFTDVYAQYKGKYRAFIEEGERVKEEKYNYILTQKDDTTFIKRVFYPETEQLTEYLTFDSQQCKNLTGPYKKWFDDGELWMSGHFKDNLRVGDWTFNQYGAFVSKGAYRNDKKYGEWESKNGDKLVQKGYFKDDKKVGKWHMVCQSSFKNEYINYQNGLKTGEFLIYDSLGVELINKGIFDNDTIVSQTQERTTDSKKTYSAYYLSYCSSDTLNYEEKRLCSDYWFRNYLYSTVDYPIDAREKEVEGIAYVKFGIDADGNVSNIEIMSGVCDSIKEACIKVLENAPKWAPAMKEGEYFEQKLVYPIRFMMR